MINIALICFTVLGAAYIFFKRNTHPGLLLLLPFFFSTNLFGSTSFQFNISGVLRIADITLLVVFFMVPFFKYKDFVFEKRNSIYYNYGNLFIFLILYFFIVLIISIFQYMDTIATMKTARSFFRYIVFFPLLYVVFRTKIEEIKYLMEVIEKFTLLAGVLYILDFAFGIEIFSSSSNINMLGGEAVQRNFLAFPVFTFLVLARLSLKKKLTKFEIIGVLILMIDILLTLTRSLVIAGVFTLLIGTFLRGKLYFDGKIMRRLVITSVVVGSVLTIVVILLFDQALNNFSERLGKLSISSQGIEASTLDMRFNIISSRIEKVWEVNPFTGLGYINPLESRKIFYPDLFVHWYDRPGSIMVNDQSWGGYIGSVGFIGLILFLALFFYPLIYLIRKKMFFNLDKEFYAVFIALSVEFFSRSIISENLFDNYFQISLFLTLFIYFIEHKNDIDLTANDKIEASTSRA